MGIFYIKKNQQAVQGFPVNRSYTKAEADNKFGGGFVGSQEKSTTTPDGIVTTFPFTHTPKIIYWNGALQTLTDDYTVSSLSITFTASAGVPQTNDKVINIYA